MLAYRQNDDDILLKQLFRNNYIKNVMTLKCIW